MTVGIQRIDVADLDLDTAGALAAIDNAALEQTVRRHHTAETFLLECRDYGTEGPLEGLWLARLDGRLVGYAGLTLNLFENLDGAKILGAVHPDHQRQGIGRVLMEAAEAATDRPRLGRRPGPAPPARAVPRLGYTRQGSHEVRRLSLRDPQPASVVAEAASCGRLRPRASRGRLPRRPARRHAGAPRGDQRRPEDGEFEAYPPERIRGYERWLAEQQQTPYTIVARHRATGAAAGITILCVHELRPAIAAQEDTSVRRGAPRSPARPADEAGDARLAARERPDVEAVDTWNAAGNAPMIAINEALGCRKVAEAIRFTKVRSAASG